MAVDVLLKRAFARPEMRGRYAGAADLLCTGAGWPAWEKSIRFKQPVGVWERASFAVRSRLEADPPRNPLEDVTLRLAGFTGESGYQMGLFDYAQGDRSRRLVEVDRMLQPLMGGVPALHKIVEVAPWHPMPEMRALQVPIDPSGRDAIRLLHTPTPVEVIEGSEGEPESVRITRRWRRVARIDDRWTFDLGQRIFQQPFSWQALGVEIRGRSRTLKINYRTSHQIRKQSDLLLGTEISDIDGNTEARSGTISVFNGPEPSIALSKSIDDESKAVAGWLTDLMGRDLEPHEVSVFVRSTDQIDRATTAVENAGLQFTVLDEGVQTTGGCVSISTMHRAKGLEFRAVAVMACDDEVIPLQERIDLRRQDGVVSHRTMTLGEQEPVAVRIVWSLWVHPEDTVIQDP